MLSPACQQELNNVWLPNITDEGLDRLIELLEKDSPLLIHGSFTRAVPQGCLATHVGWHHPLTAHLTNDAGVVWLNQVAGLNLATSQVIREWDSCGQCPWQMRQDLLEALKEHRLARQGEPTAAEQELEVGV